VGAVPRSLWIAAGVALVLVAVAPQPSPDRPTIAPERDPRPAGERSAAPLYPRLPASAPAERSGRWTLGPGSVAAATVGRPPAADEFQPAGGALELDLFDLGTLRGVVSFPGGELVVRGARLGAAPTRGAVQGSLSLDFDGAARDVPVELSRVPTGLRLRTQQAEGTVLPAESRTPSFDLRLQPPR
jgi:hypothetical protein